MLAEDPACAADDRSRGTVERFDHVVPILSGVAQGAGREDWLAVD